MTEATAVSLFGEAITWLRESYFSHCFFVERDVVWTIQTYLQRQIGLRQLSYRVFNDYPMLPGTRRSLSADLVILNTESTSVEVAVEFKYEPSHHRDNLMKHKFPVVFWGNEGVAKDITRIHKFVAHDKAKTAYSLFIDEGGYFCHRTAHPGSQWVKWKNGVWVLFAMAGTG